MFVVATNTDALPRRGLLAESRDIATVGVL